MIHGHPNKFLGKRSKTRQLLYNRLHDFPSQLRKYYPFEWEAYKKYCRRHKKRCYHVPTFNDWLEWYSAGYVHA